MQDKIIKQCKQLLAAGETQKGIDLLLEHGIGDGEDLVHQSGRLQGIKRRYDQGLINESLLIEEENKIRIAVLQQINSVGQPVAEPRVSKPGIHISYPKLFALLAGVGLAVWVAIWAVNYIGHLQQKETAHGEQPHQNIPGSSLADSTQQLGQQQANAQKNEEKMAGKAMNVKPDLKASPVQPVASKESIPSATQQCMDAIDDFSEDTAIDLIDLGACLCRKKQRPAGIKAIVRGIKKSEFLPDGYTALSRCLRDNQDEELAASHKHLFKIGLEATNHKLGYEKAYDTILVAKNSLYQHFQFK